jgi:Domain of unknown function (DUF4304)
MNDRRRAIDASLKANTIPLLREHGFKGSFPHFYRETDGHVDLLMFQFRLDGSSLVVEISYADPDRKNIYFRPDTPTAKLQVSAATKRYRLGSAHKREVDGEWLSLDCGPLTSQAHHFQKLALKINGLVLDEAEQWWDAQRASTKPAAG